MTTLSSIIPPVSVSTASGTLPATNGGTGLTSPGTAGNILTSDGTGWTSGAAPSSAVQYPQNVQSGNYTLVLADAGKQIYSANTGAQTITIPTNASVAFPIGTTITIVNRGTAQIILGVSGVSVIANGSASALPFSSVQPNNMVQLVKVGTDTWNSTFGTLSATQIEFLVASGGGGGGGYFGGGGGAGGLTIATRAYAASTTYSITVGAGGAASSSTFEAGSNGAQSAVFLAGSGVVVSNGGGGGGGYDGIASQPYPGNGGSGGGAGITGGAGGTGIAGQGFAGGSGASAGGGGAGAAGTTTAATSGGIGRVSTITGASVYYSGGGGQGSGDGVGGAGGGGNGGSVPVAGTANTGGGGGGGGGSPYVGKAGGSGVVIIRSFTPAVSTTGSPTITTVGTETVYKFNSSGTITF